MSGVLEGPVLKWGWKVSQLLFLNYCKGNLFHKVLKETNWQTNQPTDLRLDLKSYLGQLKKRFNEEKDIKTFEYLYE